QHLRLDVARLVEVPLDEAFTAAEGGFCLTYRRGIQLGDLIDSPGHLQATPAAAERRLDRDRQPVLGSERDHLVRTGHRIRGTGYERRAGAHGDVPSG